MTYPKGQEAKERILKAAITEFARKGYHAATTQDIGRQAGANASAVNYYFGSKDSLYAEVLELIFQAWDSRDGPAMRAAGIEGSPRKRVEAYIRGLFRMCFGGGAGFNPDLGTIMYREMATPSPGLDRMVERYLAPDTLAFHRLLREYLGPRAGAEVIRDCACSIVGQVLYYAFVWPIFSRLNPDHPGLRAPGELERLTGHVIRFSLAALDATRKALEDGSHPSTQE